jgi:SNF2 family DNA or RNA helicase
MRDASPEVESMSLEVEVRSFATGWDRALSRPPAVKPTAWKLQSAPPPIISLPVHAPKLRVTSFEFSTPGKVASSWKPETAPTGDAAQRPAATTSRKDDTSRRRTRLKPPGEMIKLEDRLYYALQPPLEDALGQDSLAVPFEPFDYQYEGIAFLYPRYAAILADEMGLGKTMQAITTIRLLLHAGEIRNVLLVCPKPLVANWQREFASWAPEIPVACIEGDQERRRWLWTLREAPVKLANYELLLRDEQYFSDSSAPYDLVVLDESQRIKNRYSTTAQMACSIPRRRSWALTGTPVENSTEDLVGIFEFLAPGYLSTGMKPRRMGQLAGDYIIRRTKDQVLTELPPKIPRDADVRLTAQQRESYRVAEDQGALRLSEMGDQATIQHVLELVTRLKQICNFDPATGESAKFERLDADLEEVAASGQKAIIFSQWVTTLRELSGRLKRFGTLEFHGRIPSGRRQAVLDQFQHDRDSHVLLMSYGAGGVGLNLQFAGYVFLFDRWWNPAVEDQAINRAHRIGAAAPVIVTRFLALDTIEQRIDQVLREKRELFDTIFSNTSRQRLGMTQSEIFGLFQLQGPATSNKGAVAKKAA